MLKLKLLLLVVSFSLTLISVIPSSALTYRKMVHVEPPQDSPVNAYIARSMPDINAILALQIPDPSESDERWRGFFGDLLNVGGASRQGRIHYSSPLVGFLAYIAEHKPALIMEFAEKGQIEYKVIGGLIQRGLMLDWRDFVDNPHRMLRESQMALLRLANDIGMRTAQDYAKDAFFDLESNPRSEISLVNLRFALEAMSEVDRSKIYQLLKQPDVRFELSSVMQLDEIYSKDELLGLIALKQNGNESWQRAYEVDALLMGDHRLVASMLASKVDDRIIKEIEASSSKEKHKRSTERKRYCVICAIALGADGLIGEELINTELSIGTSVRKTSSGLIIERAKPFDQQEKRYDR